MAINLLASPDKLVNDTQSNVNAGRSQLPYKFQREDYTFINGSAGQSLIQFALDPSYGLILGDFIAGQSISVGGGTPYDGFHIVDSTFDNGNGTTVRTTTPYTGDSGPGYLNNLSARPDYKVVIKILDSAQARLSPDFLYSPRPDGYLFIDVGQILIELQEESLLDSLQYYLSYAETWQDSGNPSFTLSPIIQSLYASKQLLDLGGSNMWNYLLKEASTFGNSQPGYATQEEIVVGDLAWVLNNVSGIAALNVFTTGLQSQVVYWEGFFTDCITKLYFNDVNASTVSTFDLMGYDGSQWVLIETISRINTVGLYEFRANYPGSWKRIGMRMRNTSPVLQSHTWTDWELEFNGAGGKILDVIKNEVLWRGWKKTASCILDSNIQARTGFTSFAFYSRNADINKGNIDGIANMGAGWTSFDPPKIIVVALNEPSADASYLKIDVRQSDPGAIISESKFYEVREECSNPIMLEWVNSKGGLQSWLFNYSQAVEHEVEQGLISESAINDDIEVVNRTKKRSPQRWKQSMILGADNLTKDQLNGLMEMKQSDYLVAWLDKQDTPQNIYVIISNGYIQTYQTDNGSYEFTCQIEFPDNFDFFEAKQY